ncbi:DUF4383 domain-containing protein [Actinomycetospora sp.]|uniref:DUF4383 domain-containing protein n=1 Tax=Actinomycetospora sp. TaxID=1872135 RepID=UPI002F3FA919
MFSPTSAPHHVHTVHRLAAASTGAFLLLFGVLGSVRAPAFLTTSGADVLGMSTNGLLATLSLLMGAALIFAAVRSGPVASTISLVAGGLFLASGMVNTMVMGSAMNVLSFGLVNVLFSLVVGAVLLILGAYGRFSGALPADSPYAHVSRPVGTARTVVVHGDDDRALAEAERAVALHAATPEQVVGVHAASAHRTHDQRLRAFLGAS